jgi:hypothetical protein
MLQGQRLVHTQERWESRQRLASKDPEVPGSPHYQAGGVSMEEFEFMLAVEGDPNTDENLNALFEAGCDDATFGSVDGAAYADFTREADSFEQAVLSAIEQIESVGNLRVIRIEPDDLVTAADIAERLHVTRQQVSLCVSGQRGVDKGPFPLPASHLMSRNRLWRWSEVVAWYVSADSTEASRARWIAATNVRLDSRQAAQRSHSDAAIQREINIEP